MKILQLKLQHKWRTRKRETFGLTDWRTRKRETFGLTDWRAHKSDKIPWESTGFFCKKVFKKIDSVMNFFLFNIEYIHYNNK